MKILLETNEFQTPITDELLERYPKEVQEQFFDYVNNVEFIKRLISPKRKRAKDMPKDADGKIIVDLLNPHILEDMDYFRETALHKKKTGKYTDLRPNGNPNSDYMKWLRRETQRCWYGMVRPSDGEWITGDMYFYLNYMPIELTEKIEGQKKAVNRVTSTPKAWEGAYLWFHYVHQARYGGLYDLDGGKDAIQIATRGASKSFSCASMLGKDFIVGENENYNKKVNAFILAAEKGTLSDKDGTLKKFEACADLNAELMQWPARRLYSSLDKMTWEMGYLDAETGLKKGTRNSVFGVTTNDNPEKARGSRAARIIYEEIGKFPKFQVAWTTNEPSVREGKETWGQQIGIGTGGSEGCLTGDNQVFTSNGDVKYIKNLVDSDGIIGYNIEDSKYSIENVEHINTPTLKECVDITTNSLRNLECSIDHPIYASNKYDYNEVRVWEWIPAGELKEGDLVAVCNEVPVFANEPMFDARLVGLLIGDGTYLESPRIISCDEEIKDYIRSKYKTSIYGKSYTTVDNKLCETLGIKGIRNELRELGIHGQSGNNKRLPDAIFRASREDVANLIAGLIDTDGNINIYRSNKGNRLPSTTVSIATSNIELAKQIQLLLIKLGVYANILSKSIKRIMDKNPYYSIEISSRDSIIALHDSVNLLVGYKQDRLDEAYNININKKRWRKNKFEYETIKSIKHVGRKVVYNLSAGNTHTYLGNGIITHNSNFYGILQMLYNPRGYNIYALPNIYDKNANGKGETVFFFGAYLNRGGFYNENGVSDVVATILDILMKRYIVKYNSTDPARLTQVVAERPLTIQEAIMRKESSLFPAAQLSDRKNELDANPNIYDDVYTGRMVIKNGKPDFVPSDGNVIREFPHKDNKLEGGIEIFQLPKKDSSGNVPYNRYIAGTDPVDDDDAKESLSLQSTFILDLWTDEIVAEYTGRPTFADDYYEQLRLLLMFYNARDNYENNKKGLFAYFNRMNSLYLLSDRLEYLKDKEITKVPGVGNNSKGYTANKFINGYGRLLYRNWLLTPIPTIQIVDGEQTEMMVPRLYTMKSRALIQESIQWESLGNYDRVSAMIALMLYREFMVIQYQGDFSQERVEANDKTYLGNDKFFSDNYDNRLYKGSQWAVRGQ
jgi:intein/homing endonuclease